jgi:antirestriction protein ArdC
MISNDRAKELAADFQTKYITARELTFMVANKPEEVYGDAASEQGIGLAKGAYHPNSQLVVLFSDNAKDEAQFTETMKHEVFGHHALNTLSETQKRSLIYSIKSSRDEPSLQDTWAKIDKSYTELSEDQKAEEVFAFTAQKTQENPMIVPPELRGALSLASTPITATHLKVVSKMLSKEIEAGTRSQQIYPEDDNAQFAKPKARKYPSKEPKKPLHEQVAEKLIKQIEEGTAPWQKPWEAGNHLPFNASTGSRYKGGNSLWLSMQDRSDPRWLTYKQAQDTNAQVKKGEKGVQIEFWKFQDEKAKRDDSGNLVKDSEGKTIMQSYKLSQPKVFTATVFNAEQIEGLPELEKREITWNPSERAEKIIENSGVPINHKPGNKAFYRPSSHEITMPFKEQFPTQEAYYGTLLHELGHSTGNKDLLNRDLSGSFGSSSYAIEEIRVELASHTISQEIGIPPETSRNAAYIASWVKALKDDPREIFRAAKDAEKITEYVLNLEREKAKSIDQSSQPEEAALPGEKTAIALAEKLSQKINNPADQAKFIKSIQEKLSQQPQTQTDIKINESINSSETEQDER